MTLQETLLDAVKNCNHEEEEEGGVILHNSELDSFEFVKLTNQNAGTPIAPVLWTADRNEYGSKIWPKIKEGWKHYASFHTHPKFLPLPSHIDETQLFPGFPINFIYGPLVKSVTEWTVNPDEGNETNWKSCYTVNPELNTIEITDTIEQYGGSSEEA